MTFETPPISQSTRSAGAPPSSGQERSKDLWSGPRSRVQTLFCCSLLSLFAAPATASPGSTPFSSAIPIIAAIAGALLVVGGGLIQYKIASRAEIRALRRSKLEELYSCSLQLHARAVEIVQSLTRLSADVSSDAPSTPSPACDPVRLVMLTAIYEPKLSHTASTLRESFDGLRTATQKILLDHLGIETPLTAAEISPAVANLENFQTTCAAFQQQIIERTRKYL